MKLWMQYPELLGIVASLDMRPQCIDISFSFIRATLGGEWEFPFKIIDVALLGRVTGLDVSGRKRAIAFRG
ncbi:hypothetical protein [Caballeronia sp. dw_19]|uniref:hypothetical protein n=1 Tax=Caballeronia sp. dw_19 TaxID=2719791 RepID=UPI001BD69BC2|nr:hypothetical protein [Caballeronia sp. dw_19]